MQTETADSQAGLAAFRAALAEKADLTGQVLGRIFDDQAGIPPRLKAVMQYMLQSGGKRIRSALVLCVHRSAGHHVYRFQSAGSTENFRMSARAVLYCFLELLWSLKRRSIVNSQ